MNFKVRNLQKYYSIKKKKTATEPSISIMPIEFD